MTSLLAALLFASSLAACQFGAGEEAADTAEDGSTMAPPDSCPVTPLPEPRFVPPAPYPEQATSGRSWYGGEALWTELPNDGVWRALPHHEHGYTQKVVWWRDGYNWQEEPLPELVVSGRRLDEEAPPLFALEATNGYHPDLESFMLVGVEIPTEGCWEITGRYQDSVLSFVVWVAG